jgi:hypothetical protein
MAPSSDFLKNLFWHEDDPNTPRTLPDETTFHMLWGYGGPNNNTDGVVSIASQQRAEAQAQASSNRSFAENHTGILRSDARKDARQCDTREALRLTHEQTAKSRLPILIWATD